MNDIYIVGSSNYNEERFFTYHYAVDAEGIKRIILDLYDDVTNIEVDLPQERVTFKLDGTKRVHYIYTIESI